MKPKLSINDNFSELYNYKAINYIVDMVGRKYTKNNLVCGWGVNDVDYNITRSEVINGKHKKVWVCPYYVKWVSMIKRCFDDNLHKRQQNYKGCTVTEDWKYLSNFIKWVDGQPNKDWKECELDKDFIITGNKHYSPYTCIFISKKINSFIIARCNKRGGYMIGVCYEPYDSKENPYVAKCNNPFTGRGRRLGCYPTELEAHKAWQARKHEYACKLADEQSDERVASRLREMYAPDKDWTKV